MLRKIRILAATLAFVLILFLFMDFTGTAQAWFGWLAKLQFFPALLAVNGIAVSVVLVLTFLLGRIYCSTLCPLGVVQDAISWLAGRFKKNRFRWKPARTTARWFVFAAFVVVLLVGGVSWAAVIAPYSLFGRVASVTVTPLYRLANNGLARISEQMNNYWFSAVEVGGNLVPATIVSLAAILVIAVVAWRSGRAYCNTICPVGTILGLCARFSAFKPRINLDKCNSCGLCARNCKASCINPKEHTIDYSRCVACFDCLENCRQGAMEYRLPVLGKSGKISVEKPVDQSEQESQADSTGQEGSTARRQFLTVAAFMAMGSMANAQEKPKIKFDGGLAELVDRETPSRAEKPTPPGSFGQKNFSSRCVGCLLCVQACENQVLRPSNSNCLTIAAPEMSFESGYCRPDCTKCSEVCPAGAIQPISEADKSATQIGYAVWVRDRCIVLTDGVPCGNCMRHCPNDSIQMVPSDPTNPGSLQIPTIDTERCLGCGSCEYHCPARPVSAIYVEGNTRHRKV